jgi:hypothetical protein
MVGLLAAFLNTPRNSTRPGLGSSKKATHSLIPSIPGIRTEVNKVGEVELSLMEGPLPPGKTIMRCAPAAGRLPSPAGAAGNDSY